MPLHCSVLIYNITHSDLILGVEPMNGGDSTTLLFCKPKFSYVEPISLQALERFNNVTTTTSEIHTPFADMDAVQTVVGFSFADNPILVDAAAVHFRKNNTNLQQVRIVAAYVPLAAQLIPAWTLYANSESIKHIFLVCGSGQPQDDGACATGNSTRWTAEIVSKFILQQHANGSPPLKVHILDTTAKFDLFDYHENVKFIRTMLIPRLDELRTGIAHRTDTWRRYLELTIALTQGSPARLQALAAAVTPYRPRYAHLRQLKTFWHQRALLKRDLEFLSFEAFEALPAIPAQELEDGDSRAVVAEMIRYRDEFIQAATTRDNELAQFWLRKSHRPVLSVLLVCDDNDARRTFHRGINLEVSQPTGSLCSERNAIGTALSLNPNINRRNFRMVAVLALDKLQPVAVEPQQHQANGAKRMRTATFQHNNAAVSSLTDDALNPRGPCGACTEWLKKITEVNPDFKVMTFTAVDCKEVFLREV